MFEYIFFHLVPAREFVDWLKAQGMDEKYEALLDRNEALLNEALGEEAGYHMAGISVQLKDGAPMRMWMPS